MLVPLGRAELPFDSSGLASSITVYGPYLSREFQLTTLHRVPRKTGGPQMPFLPDFKYATEPFSLPGLGQFLFAGGHPHAMECKEKGTWIGNCVNEVPLAERFDIGLVKWEPNGSYLPIEERQLQQGDEVYIIHSPILSWLAPEEKSKMEKTFPVVSIGRVVVVLGHLAIIDTVIFRGSSGGTVVNRAGKVVGVASVSISDKKADEYYTGVMILNDQMKLIINRQNQKP